MKIKKIITKGLMLVLVAAIVLNFSACAAIGVMQDKETLRSCLLDPESLIIYDAWVNENYSESGRASLFYFGAKNKGGGISDDWALVFEGRVILESVCERNTDSKDMDELMDNIYMSHVKLQVTSGHEDWVKVNFK